MFIIDGIKSEGWQPITSGTHSQLNDVAEQDVLAVTGVTTPTHVVAYLDLNAAAQGKEIRAYVKVDGTNYRSVDPEKVWATTDEKVVKLEFIALADYKITVKNTTGEAVSVPYRHTRRVMA